MAKRKEYKGTKNNLQNIHLKLNIQLLGETPTLVLYWSCEIHHWSNYLFAKCTYSWCCWSTKRNE